MRSIIRFFDKLEDKVRRQLSRFPLVYALIGGVGVVLFWRGVWHTADEYPFLTGPVSILIGTVILGLTGVLVSTLIGNSIILAGLKGEKKIEEKTQKELQEEEQKIDELESAIRHIEKEVEEMHQELHEELEK